MREVYESPLNTRYASREMLELFSPQYKFRTWRRLWIALAEAEKELGLNITDEQIDELKRYKDDINYELAEKIEKETRHDVMSHVHAYGAQCESSKGIIHLGATSCYVCDNTDIITYNEALKLIKKKYFPSFQNCPDLLKNIRTCQHLVLPIINRLSLLRWVKEHACG